MSNLTGSKMPKLKFYDLAKKKSFFTDDFDLIEKSTTRGTRFFAIAAAPSGNEAWRIVSRKFYEDNK